MNVLKIFIAPDKGKPMHELTQVRAIENVGLEGDRYSTGKGAWSKTKRKVIRNVSLFSIESFKEANSQLSIPFTLEETRRNILTQEIDLNSLVGKYFTVGNILMYGVELCDPCDRPGSLAKKSGFEEAFNLKGGLRAQILSSGAISVGDMIHLHHMKIILSSRNPSKIHQIKALMNDPSITLLTLDEAGIAGEAVEDGETLQENSLKKAIYAYDLLKEKEWILSEDTGLYIEALNGEPGIKAARWLSEDAKTEETMKYCLQRLEGITNRKATFMTVATLIAPDGTQHFFTGEVTGNLLEAPRCEPQPKMPYSPLFVPAGKDKCWAEMTTDEENKISHRGITFRKVAEFIKNLKS